MFSVGDRVRIVEGDLKDRLGTVRLITDEGLLDYIVDVDDHFSDDPFVAFLATLYGVDAGCIPFEPEQLELVERANA